METSMLIDIVNEKQVGTTGKSIKQNKGKDDF